MTEKPKISLTKIGAKKDIVKIRFLESPGKRVLDKYIAAAFGKIFSNGIFKIIVDMTNVEQPSYDFIATLIEATNKVRAKKGDIKLINISESAKHLISSFNSYSYLTIADKME